MKSLLHVVLPFLLAPSLATESARAQTPPPPPSDPVLADAAQRLAAIGYDVPAGMRSAARDGKQVIADLDAQQELFLPANAFLLQYELFRRLGLPAGRSPAALRQQTLAGIARGLSAFYDPIRKVFVLLPSATREISEALAGSQLPLFTHELVHAHQDAREGGLRAFFGAADRTLDTTLARRCIIEGEAELVAVVALRGEEAAAKTDLAAAGTLDRLLGGAMTGLIYESGRRLAFQRHREGGLDAVRALWRQAPTSTEQVLHVGKCGIDLPVAVAVPDVPGLTPAHATTLGELMIVDLLRQLGNDRLAASLAAAGWDGDRLVSFDRGDEAAVALVWRSVWDRAEDAEDFAARLTARDRLVVCVGRVVDWIAAEDGELRAAITQACAAARPQPAAADGDAASTAAAEAELRVALATSRAEGGFWRHEALGVEVPMPDGWEIKELNGVEMLIDSASAKTGFAMNLNVMAQPRGEIADLEAMVAQSRDQFERLELTVDALEITRRGDVDVIAGEYHGRIGRSPRLHFLTLGWLRGEQQVWVTATATETLWRRHGDVLREHMAGVRITMP